MSKFSNCLFLKIKVPPFCNAFSSMCTFLQLLFIKVCLLKIHVWLHKVHLFKCILNENSVQKQELWVQILLWKYFPLQTVFCCLETYYMLLLLFFLPKLSFVLLIQMKNQKIFCFKTCVGGKGHVRKTNQPPKQNPQPSSQKTWSHQEFLFVLGKYYMTLGTNWMTFLSCKAGMCSFHSREWELREPRHWPCYVVSEKRPPLWLIWLETTMRTSGLIKILSHSPYFSLLLPELSLSFFPCSPSVISSSHFTFSYLLQFLWNTAGKQGCPILSDDGPVTGLCL